MMLTNPISDKLEQINNALKQYDSFVSSTLREATDENIESYDHWINCRYEIEKRLKEIADLNSPAINNAWTPCSQNLPTQDGTYICSCKGLPETVTLLFSTHDNSWMDEYDAEYEDVEAWTPMPKKHDNTKDISPITPPAPDMIAVSLIKRLTDCFPGSFINHNIEFIAHRRANEYFILRNCSTELDIKCKILEQLSRGAHKTLPYASNKKNEDFHQFMLSGINEYLGTDFTTDDMELIYTYLGNGVNHDLTRQFVESNYDMSLLKEKEQEEEPER